MNQNTKEQLRNIGIGNEIPKYIKLEQERRARLFDKRIKRAFVITLVAIAVIFFMASCKVHIVTNYLIKTKSCNYYTEKYAYTSDAKDSIIFWEKKRNGLPKNAITLAYKDAIIIDTH